MDIRIPQSHIQERVEPFDRTKLVTTDIPGWAWQLISGTRGGKQRRHYSKWASWAPRALPVPYGYAPGASTADYEDDPMDEADAYDRIWSAALMKETLARAEADASKTSSKIITLVQPAKFPEEDYRFWRSAASTGGIWICRWCKRWLYGETQKDTHKFHTQHTKILRSIFDFAREQNTRFCFACQKPTTYERWGVPLCKKVACIQKWKLGSADDVYECLRQYSSIMRHKKLLTDYFNAQGQEINESGKVIQL